MRTLHLDCGREMRGGQWQVLRLVRGLVARGDQPLLLARGGAPLLLRAKAEGLPAQPFSGTWFPKCDLIHAHDARSHAVAAMLARAPLVVSRRVAFPVRKNVVSRWKYGQPDRFIAVSRFVKLVLREAEIPDAKIDVVYDGAPLLAESNRSGGAIVPASKSGGLSLAAKPSVDLESGLATAAAMVYITDCEGLGSAVLLAMSAGVPVVASRVGGIPEIVEDGVDGLLVENSEREIREALRRVMESPERFGRAARAKVAAQFSEARMVEETWKVYRKLLTDA